MIRHAYVQVQQAGRPDPEARALLEALPRRGVKVETFTLKQLTRRRLSLSEETLVAGDMDAVRAAMKQLGWAHTPLPSYPSSLHERLGRRVWETALGAAIERVQGHGEPVFVKPSQDAKRFTGLVLRDASDSFRLAGASRKTPVFCSDVIELMAEYRGYVVEGRVAALCQYSGDARQAPPGFVESMLASMSERAEAKAGFAIDIGVMPDGEVVLVECNEGYALGLYEGLADDDYADLICARWRELGVEG